MSGNYRQEHKQPPTLFHLPSFPLFLEKPQIMTTKEFIFLLRANKYIKKKF